MADIPERLARLESEIVHQKEFNQERFDQLEEKIDRNYQEAAHSRNNIKQEVIALTKTVGEFKELIAMAKGVKFFLSVIAALVALLAALGVKDLFIRYFVKT